jgi:RNA 2',3'-cyclic 3'-phosphodiesterase
MMDQIRSFIAIELPGPVKDGLRKIQDHLRLADSSGAKWVEPEGIHLTLKFLGNVEASRMDQIIRLMGTASQVTGPFRLELKRLGAFPNLRKTQIVWVGISGDLDKLQILQKRLEDDLSRIGFPPEGRAFTPHLTLARLRDYATPLQRQTLGEAIALYKLESDLVIQVNTISLMKSQLTRTGAIYTELASIELKPSC